MCSLRLKTNLAVCGIAAMLLAAPHGSALAAAVVRVQSDSVQLEANNASIREILDALSAKFNITYVGRVDLSRRQTARYSGTLLQVLNRVLDGNDYIIRTEDERLEVKLISVSRSTAIVSSEQRSTPVLGDAQPKSPPPLNSYLAGSAEASAVAGNSQ